MTARGPLAALFGQGYFNANKLSPTQVASLFVLGERFESLGRVDNAVITGPRGSGKTTLMKMLTREALASWEHPLSRALLARPILPLYFGSDVVQRSQVVERDDGIDELARTYAEAAADVRTLQRAKLSLHFLHSILSALRAEVLAHRAAREPGAVDPIVEVAALWGLSLPYKSWDALYSTASHAIDEISRALRRLADGSPTAARSLAARLGPPALSDLFVRLRDEVLRGYRGLPDRWVLLFDEVEYFPANVRSELIHLVRTLGPEFGLKLAFTPLSTTGGYLREVDGAFLSSGHEYLHFNLSADQSESRSILEFSSDLTRQVFDLVGAGTSDLSAIFGVSPFAPSRAAARRTARAVIERPDEDDLFAELIGNHRRFAEYARAKGMSSPEERDLLSPAQRAARIRKALPVMLLWRERLSSTGEPTRQEMRSRKTSVAFTGAPTILEIGDGNPRTTLRVLDRMLAASGLTGSVGDGAAEVVSVDSSAQVLAIDVEREVQLALAEVYLARHGAVRGLVGGMELLDQLGQAFERHVYTSRRFDPDPVTAFVLDEGVAEPIAQVIGDAVYTGVLVDTGVPDKTAVRTPATSPLRHLYGRRYRLSYLLGTAYWLPVRLGQWKHLSTLLRRTPVDPRGGEFSARTLFDG